MFKTLFSIRGLIGVGCIVLAVLVILGFVMCQGLGERSGVAPNVTALANVYRDAGPEYAAFYTNSFLQKLSFTTPITWRRWQGRGCIVFLTGSIDVAAFRRDMINEHFQFLRKENGSGTNLVTFTINHRFGELVVVTNGKLDSKTGSFSMDSCAMEHMIDDWQWHQITNASAVDFQF